MKVKMSHLGEWLLSVVVEVMKKKEKKKKKKKALMIYRVLVLAVHMLWTILAYASGYLLPTSLPLIFSS